MVTITPTTIIANLQAFHAAIAVVAPISGVRADGTIMFLPNATPAQIAAANAAVAAFVDQPSPHKPNPLETLLIQAVNTPGSVTAAQITAALAAMGQPVAIPAVPLVPPYQGPLL